jgi:hypothetical protein
VPIDHRPSRPSLGTRRDKSRRAICDFFPKPESDLTRSCAQQLGGTKRAKGVSSRPHHGACFFGMIHRRADG